MFFNFKNKNLIIILLLLLVLASIFCYSMMVKDIEGNTNMSDSFSNNFKIYKLDRQNNVEYYTLENNTGLSTEASFTTDRELGTPTATVTRDVINSYNGGINKYMYDNSYDIYKITQVTQNGITIDNYDFYTLNSPLTINLQTLSDNAAPGAPAASDPATGEPATGAGAAGAAGAAARRWSGGAAVGFRG